MVSDATSTRLTMDALVCLVIPVFILAVFAVGEVAGGDSSGLQHVVQLLPLVGLAWLEWRVVSVERRHLACVALFFAGIHLMLGGFPPFALLVNALLLFGPPVLAGVLFVAAARRDRATNISDQGAS